MPKLPHKFILNSCDNKTIPVLFHQVFLGHPPKNESVFISVYFWVLSLFWDRGAVPNGWQIAAYKADFIRGDDHVQSSVGPTGLSGIHGVPVEAWNLFDGFLVLSQVRKVVDFTMDFVDFSGLVMDFEGIFPACDVLGWFGSICGRDGEASRR